LESASDVDAIDGVIRFTHNLLRELNIPPLKQFGIGPERVEEMVALARKASSMRFNPVSLSDESLSAALVAAIEGDAGPSHRAGPSVLPSPGTLGEG
jgi:alcohol dehydrogenase class IV